VDDSSKRIRPLEFGIDLDGLRAGCTGEQRQQSELAETFYRTIVNRAAGPRMWFTLYMASHIVAPPLAGNVIGSDSGAFVIAEWRDEGGPAGPPRLISPLHRHHRDDEAWYVLEGSLCVQMDAKIVEAAAGAAVFVPRGAAHTFWNPAPGRVRYLLVMTSNTYRMIQAIHAMQDRSPAALRALFAKYDSEIVEA